MGRKGTQPVQESRNIITVRIRRGVDDHNHVDAYRVPVEAGQSVLGVLQHIYDHLDPTLAFSCSCRIGLCSACLVRVNGQVVKACTTLADGDMLIEPYKDGARIRDLASALPPLAAQRAD
jgi:succinate dehydrogenase/fumarate reductase-like Fe-S protein